MRLILLLSILSSSAYADEIYKWVDKQGNTHFTDRPPVTAKAEEVEVRVNSYTAPAHVNTLSGELVNRSSKSVVMYIAEWCGVCKRAKDYFRANKIRYKERDIDKSPSARREYDTLNGTGVPIILVGDQRMNGFSESKIEKMLK